MWQGWAQHLSLARMVEREDGALDLIATAQRGVQTFDRSRANVATKRSRGRFARRRRMGVTRVGVARVEAGTFEQADESIACE